MVKRYDGRNVRRLSMRRPAEALFSNRRVQVHDLSATGFGITHDFALKKGDTGILEFRWGSHFAITCTVIRCVAHAGGFRSGLAFDRCPPAYRELIGEALARKARHEATLPDFFSGEAEPKT
jgi:hypothetical protein